MKFLLLLLVISSISVLGLTTFSFGACPEAPYDNGLCDTLRVEVYPPDTVFYFPGQLVRVPIYVTHDVPDPFIDSLVGMLIPLCYTHTNPTKYCSVSAYWNAVSVSGSSFSRSIFRDIDGINNRFLDMYLLHPNLIYNDFMLNVSQYAFIGFVWRGTFQDSPRWGTSSHDLALTFTFRVQDTMTICIDTCFWPPSDRLAFSRSDAVTYIPRHNLSYCFSISCPVRGNPTGGINGDCRIDVGDIIFLIGYLYKSAPPPDPLERGDANCNGVVDIGDIIYLINYLFKGGPAPTC